MSESELNPLVSIVTPSYNQGKFIEETILSVLMQDYKNIEYIIIDGGSQDKSVEIIKKYSDSLAFWISEPDNGQTDAIVKGFRKAKGKYITWLCSDDIIEPSMISISVSFLENNPEYIMTYGDRSRYDDKGNIIGYHRYCEFRPWLLKWGFAIPQETVLIRHQSYLSSGGLDTNLEMAMDFDLFCNLSHEGKIKHLPFFLGRFRSHNNNKSTHFNTEVSKTGFNAGYPLELTKVYRKQFKKEFPEKKWRMLSVLIEILGFLDRRITKYRRDKKFL